MAWLDGVAIPLGAPTQLFNLGDQVGTVAGGEDAPVRRNVAHLQPRDRAGDLDDDTGVFGCIGDLERKVFLETDVVPAILAPSR